MVRTLNTYLRNGMKAIPGLAYAVVLTATLSPLPVGAQLQMQEAGDGCSLLPECLEDMQFLKSEIRSTALSNFGDNGLQVRRSLGVDDTGAVQSVQCRVFASADDKHFEYKAVYHCGVSPAAVNESGQATGWLKEKYHVDYRMVGTLRNDRQRQELYGETHDNFIWVGWEKDEEFKNSPVGSWSYYRANPMLESFSGFRVRSIEDLEYQVTGAQQERISESRSAAIFSYIHDPVDKEARLYTYEEIEEDKEVLRADNWLLWREERKNDTSVTDNSVDHHYRSFHYSLLDNEAQIRREMGYTYQAFGSLQGYDRQGTPRHATQALDESLSLYWNADSGSVGQAVLDNEHLVTPLSAADLNQVVERVKSVREKAALLGAWGFPAPSLR